MKVWSVRQQNGEIYDGRGENPFSLEENEDRHTEIYKKNCMTVLCGIPDQVGDDDRTGRDDGGTDRG